MKKGEHVKIQNFNWIPSILFHFLQDLPFSPRHLLESEERFVNLFCNFSPLCAVSRGHADMSKRKEGSQGFFFRPLMSEARN